MNALARNVAPDEHLTATSVLAQQREAEQHAAARQADYLYHEHRAAAQREYNRMANNQMEAIIGAVLGPTRSPFDPDESARADQEARVKAEALLQKFLPPELYVRLNALGYFEIAGQINRSYSLSKDRKTHCTFKDGTVWSCCIEFQDEPNAPIQDRLVAEYLLIKDDEKKYLKTANLSRINPVGQGGIWGASAQLPVVGLWGPGPTAPAMARQRLDRMTIAMISHQCMRLMNGFFREWRDGQRFREWRGAYDPSLRGVARMEPRTFSVEMHDGIGIPSDALRLSIDEFSQRYLRTGCSIITSMLRQEMARIERFVELPMTYVDHAERARTIDRDHGGCLRVSMDRQIMGDDTWSLVMDIGAVLGM